MKNTLHITALLDKPELLENMVEKLAGRHYDIGYGKINNTGTWQALDTSSIEKYVSGTVNINFKGNAIHMPFITSFLFSCTKEKSNAYKLNWSMSLS